MPKTTGIYHAPWERSFDRILSPLEEFIHRQTTSGILLMICAVIALFIANSPLHDSYQHLSLIHISEPTRHTSQSRIP